MSSLMRDWIRPTVCDQLNEAVREIEQPDRTSKLYGGDGTLMLHITTGASIQLNEFISHAAPYLARVSDSFTQIRATFSKSSTDLFQKHYGRDFSCGTLGAVLGITDYYLTLNPNNAPSCQIMFEIECFTMLGGEGTRTFGRPIPIGSAAKVEDLMMQLHMEWRKHNLDQLSPLHQISHIKSQAGIAADASPSPTIANFTSETFSTQATEKVSHRPATDRRVNPNASKRALLDILGPKRRGTTQVRDHEPLVPSSSLNAPKLPVQPTKQNINRAQILPVSPQHSEIPQSSAENSITDGLPSNKDGRLEGDPPVTQATPNSTVSNGQATTEVNGNNVNGILMSHDIPIENPNGARTDTNKSSRDIIITSTVPQKQYMRKQPIQGTRNPWEGLTRIPRKYVQIPKDQKSILDSDHAWCSQASGNWRPDKSLPRQVLNDLQAFHNRLRHNEKIRQSDNQSESSSEDSESQEDAARDLASPKTASSQRNMHSMISTPTVTELGLKGDEQHVKNIAKSHIEVRNALPSDIITSGSELDLSNTSEDVGDESPVEDLISWPSSPNRIESAKSLTPLLPEGSQEFGNVLQVDLLNSFQSQVSSGKNSPTKSRNAACPLTEEGERKLKSNPSSDSHNCAGLRPTMTIMRIAQASIPSCNDRNVFFSSSPVEMEISVPYALESQSLRSDDIFMNEDLHSAKHVSFPKERTHSYLEIECIDRELRGRQLPQKKSHDVKIDSMSMQQQQMADVSSDPVIPGTYENEASNFLIHPAKAVSLKNHAELDHVAFNANQVASATPALPSTFNLKSNLPVDDKEYSNGSKNPGEGESQKLPDIRNTSQLSTPWTQKAYLEPLYPSARALSADEIIFSTLVAPTKRRAYENRDIDELSPKRRRTLQAVIFDGIQERDSPVDPTEMAKANRRKFLQDLSLDDSSPLETLPNPQKVSVAPSYVVTLAETSLEQISTNGTLISPSNSSLEAHQSHQKIDLSGEPLEKVIVEELQKISIDYAKHGADNTDGGIPNENYDDVNTQKDGVGLARVENANSYRYSSTNKIDFERWEDSLAISKVQSGFNDRSRTETIFEMFNKAYPNYGKSLRAFVRASVYLDWLYSIRRAPHPSLWDDFIRAFSAEYANHIDECRLSHQKPTSAHTFYNNHVLIPFFMKRIMTPGKLQEALLLDPRETAKNCAIIMQKKCQKDSESMSTASSQLTMTSETFPESQERANFYPATSVSICPPPSEPAITDRISPDHEKDVALAPNHIRNLAKASDRLMPAKKPFFETPSQLATRDSHENIESLHLSRPTPSGVIGVNVNMKTSSEGPRAPDIEIVHINGLGQTPRHFPLPYSSRQKSEPEELLLGTEDIRNQRSTTIQCQTHRQSPFTCNTFVEREESPILGSGPINHIRIRNHVTQTVSSPSSLTNLGFRQGPKIKVPGLTALNPVGRRAISISGLGESDLEISPISHKVNGFRSQRMRTTQRSGVSKNSATFKDFSKAFVPRQKRRSSIATGRPSAVVTDPSSTQKSRTTESHTLESRQPLEPGTQAWRF